MDPADVRRINLIAPFDEPHTTVIGQTYDVGDYVGALDRALDGRRLRRRCGPSRRRRREPATRSQLGIGVSVYVEITGGVAPHRRGRPRSRSTTTAGPPSTPARRPTARATTPRGR